MFKKPENIVRSSLFIITFSIFSLIYMSVDVRKIVLILGIMAVVHTVLYE